MIRCIRSFCKRNEEFWQTWGIVILLALLLFIGLILRYHFQPTYTTKSITVQPGESLYSIAAKQCPREPRDATIAKIERLNPDMRKPYIHPGDKLQVPAEVSRGADRVITCKATAYCLTKYNTATGRKTGPGIVAVDPNVIPLGSELEIEGYGRGIAADTGDDIKGNRIDLWMSSYEECIKFGRRDVQVTIIE